MSAFRMSARASQIKHRKKRKETITEDGNEFDDTFAEFDLKIFCPKPVFDVIFVAGNNESSRTVLTNLIENVKGYEDISSVSFITRDDVLKLLTEFDPTVFPGPCRDILQEVHRGIVRKSTQNESSTLWLVQLMKLKLMEVMSRHFLADICNMERRNILESELAALAQDSKKSTKKTDVAAPVPVDMKKSTGTLAEKKSRGKIDTKMSLAVEIGYKLTRTNSDIIFDDDIYNHVWFYVFQGFMDANVLDQLDSHNVPIRALMEFNLPEPKKSESSCVQETFWKTIPGYFYGPKRSTNFENTILMKFEVTPHDSFMEIFEELLYVIKNISDFKLRHIHYIRHIKINELKENNNIPPLECLLTYNFPLDQVPIELTNEVTILKCLLNETLFRTNGVVVEDPWDTISSRTASTTQLASCQNPCDLREMFGGIPIPRIAIKKPSKTFMVHESDLLRIISNTYKRCGPTVVDATDDILRTLKPFSFIENIEIPTDDLIHKHDVDPSDNLRRQFSLSQLHFLYLFLFSTFKHDDTVEEFQENELTQNLHTYNRALFYYSSLPEVENDSSDGESVALNLFDPSPMAFIWKEKLHSLIMIQEIWNNQQAFQYMDIKYSPETDNVLVQFSDHLDEFGINTKLFDVTLRTPVCLRDFCRYVTVDEREWLEKNKPEQYVRKSEEMEECKGARKIKNLDLFEEYRYLLDPKEKPDGGTEDEIKDEVDDLVTFGQMLAEIQNYPRSNKLIEECGVERDKDFLAYDFGTQYFAVRGTETIFSSHDNVKVKVDNTRMIYEEPKCTVSVTSRGHSLILHSNKAFLERGYTFHWNLEDGTIISFSLHDNQRKSKRNSVTPSEPSLPEEVIGGADEEETCLQHAINQKVINLSRADFEGELKGDEDVQIDDPSEEDITNIYKSLKQAILEECPVYKIGKDLTYLKKLNAKTEIPLTNIIRRLLHYTKKQSPESYTKTFTNSTHTDRKKTVDFRVCLPNGLYITCHASQLRENLVEVKQEFVSEEKGRIEEFRLFTRDGCVLIKKIDGTFTMLKSNGDTITFEKPDSKNPIIRESNLKTCHCKNLNDYRKKLNRMTKDKAAKDKFYTSRRDLFRTKKGYIINEDIAAVLESNKVPYLRITLLSFDGNRTSLEHNKITQKRLHHTTSEQDFVAEELYFERSDGFQSLFEKNGSQIVKFADGTQIRTSIHVSKQLVDSYVFVSLNFSYGHPDYATVTYDFVDTLSIHLQNATIQRYSNDDILLRIGDDITSKVTSDIVSFEKNCTECDSTYSCSFSIDPFLSKNLDYSAEFLHAQDSYDRHFYVDFAGNSKRNKSNLTGPLNKEGCNHYKNNNYKALFVVGRALGGEQFWNNQMIEMRRQDAENDIDSTVVEESDIYDTEITTFEFRKQHLKSLAAKFVNTRLLEEEVCLSKYKKNHRSSLMYSTNRFFKKMVDIESVKALLTDLSLRFTEKNETEEELEQVIRKNDDFISADVETLGNVRKKPVAVISDNAMKICKCVKHRKTIQDKISCWKIQCDKFKELIRMKKIPGYFDSQFCEVIE